jgi:hypothetical protein
VRQGLLVIGAMIFYVVCILLFPAMLVGYVLWVGKAYAGRKSGVSRTAQGPLSARGLCTDSARVVMSQRIGC